MLCFGCSMKSKKAIDAVEMYLNNYKNLNDEVSEEINNLVNEEDLSEENKEIYKDVLKRQYKDILYTIENEDYNGDEARVSVKLTVYDYYKVQKDAYKYMQENIEEFMQDNIFEQDKYDNYKLKKMLETNEAIGYTVVFKVKKDNGNWIVEQPSKEVLEKIHGIYNYEED